LATLRAVLDHPGMAEAAAALGIHRNTLAYRLAVIERRTGWSMSDPLVRFGLALAIRFVQTDQGPTG
jgi:DNA-binding PucR family transcriptional regulator